MTRNFKLPKDYEINNPNIIDRIRSDVNSNKEFHYFFVGCYGSGKTYLAEIIKNHFKNVKFISAGDIYADYLNIINSNLSDKYDAADKRLHCMRSKFVILDDLGNEKPRTISSRSFIESILEDRYRWVKKGFGTRTIITTNLSGDLISELYGDHVLDRIHGIFTLMRFEEKSFRRDKLEIIEE